MKKITKKEVEKIAEDNYYKIKLRLELTKENRDKTKNNLKILESTIKQLENKIKQLKK